MNEYLVKKLKEGRANVGLKQSDVARMIGLKGNTLSNYENGVSEPDIDTFCALCYIYNLDVSDILGEAYGLNVAGTDFDIKPSEIEHVKKYRFITQHSPAGKETVDYIMNREYDVAKMVLTNKKKDDNISSFSRRIISYYYKNASAGSGQPIIDNLPEKDIEIPDIPEYRNASYAIGVNGSSMEPAYYDGDILLVEATREIALGEIGIFQIDGECYVKELGETELISLNKKYPNVPLNESALTMGKVIGKL